MTLLIKTLIERRRYAPGGSGESYYFEALAKLRPRLQQGGHIRTSDAWEIAGGHYGMISTIFRNILEEMVEKGHATRQAKGRYWITKPDIPFEPAAPKQAQPARVILMNPNKVEPWYSEVYGCWLGPAKRNDP